MRPAARRFLETRAPGMDPRCTRGTRRSGSAHGWTLMPTPMTTVQTRPETDPSRRIPPSFRSRQTMSFGHLSAMPLAPVAASARAGRYPDRKAEPLGTRLRRAESPEQRQTDIATRSVHPGPPARPRPARWCSLRHANGLGRERDRSCSQAFVESMAPCTHNPPSRAQLGNAARIRPASSASIGTVAGTLKRTFLVAPDPRPCCRALPRAGPGRNRAKAGDRHPGSG